MTVAMKIPQFWAREDFTARAADGSPVTRTAFGWSFESRDDAQRHARERAQRAVDASVHGRLASYNYSDLPLREPVLESIDVGGENVGLVSRNRYGCRVLNADSVLFADIDLDRLPAFHSKDEGVLGFIKNFFKQPDPPKPAPEDAALARIDQWHRQRPAASLRVYRTHSGLRLLFTDRQYSPTDPAAIEMLKSLGSDPLYVSLTKRQECFRARLSPKPWRCNVATPNHVSFFDHPDYAARLAAWAEDYEPAAARYATCRLLRTFGPDARDPVIQRIVALHDRSTLDPTHTKPLA